LAEAKWSLVMQLVEASLLGGDYGIEGHAATSGSAVSKFHGAVRNNAQAHTAIA
jgi:hypothetical protein